MSFRISHNVNSFTATLASRLTIPERVNTSYARLRIRSSDFLQHSNWQSEEFIEILEFITHLVPRFLIAQGILLFMGRNDNDSNSWNQKIGRAHV